MFCIDLTLEGFAGVPLFEEAPKQTTPGFLAPASNLLARLPIRSRLAGLEQWHL